MVPFWYNASRNFVIMKPKKPTSQVTLPKGFTIKPGLDEKYADQPLFKEKVDRANHILKTFGLPKTKLG